jgi:fimbrial isopeptide formation D2 family protein
MAFAVWGSGYPNEYGTAYGPFGLRPALRLKLDDLLLSAHSGNQSQVLSAPDSVSPDSLRLTFVDSGKRVWLSGTPTVEQESDGGDWVLKGVGGSSNLGSQSGFGWKLVDSEDTSGEVVASGRTNYDAAAASEGNMVVPCSALTPGRDYVLSVWGQEDGSGTKGWSNRATVPVTGTVRADGAGGCGPLDMTVSEPFGIALTGQTDGVLTAYKIGEYDETVFSQSGALKSVLLNTPSTPSGLKTVLKNAAVAAGGGDVDAGNPIGWVASRWLGYPTDPLSDDVTSAFSPYAGSLQLFAQELAKDTGALGAAAGSLPKLDGGPETLKVSGPGLYLIVDSSQGSGGSLPIVVGTKVFNDALGDDGGFVDFVNAGVKGKPRLGVASLKTTVTDVAKRIVNDAGLDGFDVGSEVEYEIALRVPDLSGFTNVSYDSYVFDVADVAASGLTLPADGSGVEVFVDALSPTQPQTLPPSSIAVSGDTLSVDGLKAVFAESSGSGVRNKDSVPVGSLMRIRYKAVLNASAVVSAPVEGTDALKPNVNTVTLTRSRIGEVSNGWTDAGAGLESKAATANMYTFKLDVVKLDKDDLSKKLGGVEFEVSRDGEPLKFTKLSDGEYRLGDASGTEVVVTKSDGTLSLQGVEARELSFKETNAPSGYFKVSDFGVDIRPEWNEDATQVTKVTYATSGTNLAYVSKDGEQVVVLDPAWSLANLPYTGGVGILVLLIVGGLMLVFAVRPYVLSKRAERDANLV